MKPLQSYILKRGPYKKLGASITSQLVKACADNILWTRRPQLKGASKTQA
jgi:hypothetical protein